MTDSEARQEQGKRERLVEGARRTFHEQGVQQTTIADVAAAAGVPLGNVYYYFKSKDDLIEAVIDAQARHVQTTLATFERHRSPQARLKALVRMWIETADLTARHGCPQGGLCHELDKRDDSLGGSAARLLTLTVDWAERQFRELGRRDARDLALALVASFQGAALLTNTLDDPDIMVRQGRRLERWIDSLVRAGDATAA